MKFRALSFRFARRNNLKIAAPGVIDLGHTSLGLRWEKLEENTVNIKTYFDSDKNTRHTVKITCFEEKTPKVALKDKSISLSKSLNRIDFL